MVNFILFILVSVKCRLQTIKVQTEGKMQTEECSPRVKCRLKESTVYDCGLDLIVKRKSKVLSVLKLLIQSTNSKIMPTFTVGEVKVKKSKK